MTHCLSILIKALLLKSCRKCKVTNIRTSGGLKLVNGLNGPVDTRWRNIHWNNETGEITIRNIQRDQSGDYKLEINTTSMILHRKLHIDISDGVKSVSVKERESVFLNTGVTDIQGYDLMWKIEDNLIAEINKGTKQFLIIDKDNKKFNGRLQMHHQSGSLTLSDSETKDSGVYHLNMISSTHTIQRNISVTVKGVFGDDVTVMEGDSVTLNPDTVIPEDDTAQWWFGDKLIAKINKADGLFSTSKGDDVGFKGKLELDHQTGSLTITNTRTNHTGLYKLQIRGKTGVTPKIFSVTVRSGESHGYLKWLIIGLVVIIIVLIIIIIFIKRKFVCCKKQTLSYSSTPNPMADPRAN